MLGGIEIKKRNCLALMILLIITGIAFIAFAAGNEPAVLSGYKPTYTPNANYNSPEPVQVGTFYGSKPAQLSSHESIRASGTSPITAASSALIQEEFLTVGDSNETIPGSQFVGSDGSGNNFQEFADGNGYIAIVGSPGNWQFAVYAPGYFTKKCNINFAYNTYEVLLLQKIGDQQPLNIVRLGKGLTTKKITKDGCELNNSIEQDNIEDPSTYTDDAKG